MRKVEENRKEKEGERRVKDRGDCSGREKEEREKRGE